MTNLEAFELKLERRLERYQQRYKIAHADLSWILLRIGTNYYFKDICSRGPDGQNSQGVPPTFQSNS